MPGLPDTLDAFAGKWISAEPELGLALRFMPVGLRAAQAAYACLQREISQAALGIREAEVAQAKLGWWLEELLRSRSGEPRHPLTEVLKGHGGFADVAASRWQDIIVAAIQLRERDPAADLPAMLAAHEVLHGHLAAVEKELFGPIDAAASARVAACAQVLRELAAIGPVLETGHLPLPLDLLARHQLTRDGLASDGSQRRRALRDQAAALAAAFDRLIGQRPRLGLIRTAGLVADRARARIAARSDDPSIQLASALQRLPFATTWAVWRAAR